MKIVILDGHAENPGDLSWDSIAAMGDLTVYDRTPAELIAQRIGDAQIVITNKTPLTEKILDLCPGIRFIDVLATGYNVVDIQAAKVRGIPVSNVPAYGTATVAQYTFALLLELCHHVSDHSRSVHAGDWTRSSDFSYWLNPMVELAGKTMGIIGFGRIGQAAARIAKAFGMHVLATGSHVTEDGLALAEYVDLDTLLRSSDVISLHCPATPATIGTINSQTIAKMRDGAFLINTGRGQLVVEDDLARALISGKVGAAALDVVSTEPILPDNPLLQAPNCIITPHVAWAAKEARQRIMDITAENIRCFLSGHPQNVVNP